MAFGIRLCTVMIAIATLAAACSSGGKGGSEGKGGTSSQATSASNGSGGATASSTASSSAPVSTAGSGGTSSTAVGGSAGQTGRTGSEGGKDSGSTTAGAGTKAATGGTSLGASAGATGGSTSSATTGSGGTGGSKDSSANDSGAKDGGAGADLGAGSDGGDRSAAKPSAGCGKTPSLQKSAPPPNSKIVYNQITSAGLNRRYILWYPDNYDKTRPYRLIMNYHWYSGSASQVFDCSTEGINCYTTQTPFFGLMNLADNSTIFVAPDGIDAGWANTNGRDTTLTDDILKQVEDDLCIDTNRIFAEGFSYGGAMSATLGCQRAEVFRGVVVFAGGISGMSGACTGKTPIAYYGATGTQDSGYTSGQTAVKHFAEVNGCTTQTLPTPPSGGHTCISFAGCSSGYPVHWCAFDEGHTPSPKDRGAATTWQPKEVWTFLTQF